SSCIPPTVLLFQPLPDNTRVAVQAERRHQPDRAFNQGRDPVLSYPVAVTLQVVGEVLLSDLLIPPSPCDLPVLDPLRALSDPALYRLPGPPLSHLRLEVVVDDTGDNRVIPDAVLVKVHREDHGALDLLLEEFGVELEVPEGVGDQAVVIP